MGEQEAKLIADTAEATSKAVAEALSHLRLHPAPTTRLSKFFDRPQKVGDLTITEWVRDVEVYTRQMGFDGADKLAALTDHLGGNAREEYLCADQAVKGNFDQLCSLLKRRFGPAEELPVLSAAFSSRVQQEGENLTAYSRALMRLYARMEAAAEDTEVKAALTRLKDMSLKGQFKKGVASENVSKDIERMDIHKPTQSFNEMREEIIKLYGDGEAGGRKPRVRQVEAPDILVEAINTGDKSNNSGVIQALLDSQRQTNARLDKLIDAMGQSIPSTNAPYTPPSFTPCVSVPQAGAFRYHDYTNIRPHLPQGAAALPDMTQPGSIQHVQYGNPSIQYHTPTTPYRPGFQGHDGPNRKGTCFYCGVFGHFRQDCPVRKSKRQAPNQQNPQNIPNYPSGPAPMLHNQQNPQNIPNYPSGPAPMLHNQQNPQNIPNYPSGPAPMLHNQHTPQALAPPYHQLSPASMTLSGQPNRDPNA
jgi:hypothetical protein